MENEVKTLADAIRYFSDEQVCIDTVAGMRWPNGPIAQCLSQADRQHWLKTQRAGSAGIAASSIPSR